MKKLLLSAAAMTLLFTACKKKDDDSGLASNTWKVAGTTYTSIGTPTASGGTLISSGLNGSDGSGLAISFGSGSLPTTGGTYKIVDDADTAGEIDILVSKTAGTTAGTWGSKAGTSATATVTVDGGKVKVVVPEITLAPLTGTGDVTFSANISQ